jgi:hypothetical protein
MMVNVTCSTANVPVQSPNSDVNAESEETGWIESIASVNSAIERMLGVDLDGDGKVSKQPPFLHYRLTLHASAKKCYETKIGWDKR